MTSSPTSDFGSALGGLLLAVAVIALCLLPYIIARRRGHAYRNIILVLCIFGFTGIAWVIALIWALYPSEKSLVDPVIGNVTGTGVRNAGDTLGSVQYGRERGYAQEQASAPRFCTKCGSASDTGQKFCAACGAAH
jgi:hypothetical protein